MARNLWNRIMLRSETTQSCGNDRSKGPGGAHSPQRASKITRPTSSFPSTSAAAEFDRATEDEPPRPETRGDP